MLHWIHAKPENTPMQGKACKMWHLMIVSFWDQKIIGDKGRVQNKKTENIMNLALFPFGPSLHP